MRAAFQDRNLARLIWIVFGISLALLIWQGVAFFTGNIPRHILPAVVMLSGTQESIPVAYSWTLDIGILSVLGILSASASLLIRWAITKK
jgi:hypothetical protein